MDQTPGVSIQEQLFDEWPHLERDERLEWFRALPPGERADFFLSLSSPDQAELVLGLPRAEQRTWLRILAPDDVADVLQECPRDLTGDLLDLLDTATRAEVQGLLTYSEDAAGGLMNPRFARVRPAALLKEALAYVRRQAHDRALDVETIYVIDEDGVLLGILSLGDLLFGPTSARVRDVMKKDFLRVTEDMDQEEVARLFAHRSLFDVPVVDAAGRMQGVVTVDDIVDVVQEEATEDAQKFGGMEALEAPYLKIGLPEMLRKRGGWLLVLFLSETFTATAMSYYEHAIERAMVLALFIPLIISSGGNSGSQASTLVIRAMALGELRPGDWWRVMLRELVAGGCLGGMLGMLGLMRIALWPNRIQVYGEHFLLVGITVGITLVGIVTWGTLTGALLPFLLRRVGFDPASASAPFVATLVDVTGLALYFTVASMVLEGTLL